MTHLALSGSLVSNVVMFITLAGLGSYTIRLRGQLNAEKCAHDAEKRAHGEARVRIGFLERKIDKLHKRIRKGLSHYRQFADSVKLHEQQSEERISRLRLALSVVTRRMKNVHEDLVEEKKRTHQLEDELFVSTWDRVFCKSEYRYYKAEADQLSSEKHLLETHIAVERKGEVKRSFWESLIAHVLSAFTGG
jgi:chromosome segregation ATPase